MLFNKTKKLLSIFIAPPAGPNPPPAGGYLHSHPMEEVPEANIIVGQGIENDRWFGVKEFALSNGVIKPFPHKRQVSLLLYEEFLQVKESFPTLEPIMLRRNLLIKGYRLEDILNKKIKIGTVILQYSGQCHACSHIEEATQMPGLAKLLYDHGGIRAEVLCGGFIRKGEHIQVL